MSTPQHAEPSEPVVDRFLATIGSRRTPKHRIDDAEYVEMLWRMVRHLEIRAIDDPALLPQVVALVQRFEEISDVVIAANAARYKIDPKLGASGAECGRILGHKSKQVTSLHAKKGREVIARRDAAAGVTHISRKGRVISSETAREREVIAAAAEYGVTVLADFRARRAS
jgi:hypothetical protein